MGRIRTGHVKRSAERLIKIYKDEFTKDFDKNKKKVDEHAEIQTKKLRNQIAGYITKRIKTTKEIEL